MNLQRGAGLLFAILFLPVAGSSTDCAPHNSQWPGEQSTNFITLVSPTNHSWISGGADQWNTTCDVEQIPFFDTAPSNVSGTFNVTVDYRGGRNPGTQQTGDGCGRTNMGFNSSGTMVTAEILIFDQDSDGFPCDDDYDSLMAHELGHLMGLGHSPFGPSCQGSIMYPVHLEGVL